MPLATEPEASVGWAKHLLLDGVLMESVGFMMDRMTYCINIYRGTGTIYKYTYMYHIYI